ncbi:PI-PLC domain-containing protein [Parafrankia elaeagni]|uniref:hypothetical protein n=1 Tax=Parafrankia elaeagni TaxID=222534 RepID=UPI00035D1EEA|nr:hypothetical protein [Parafrankia elaeagni]
MIGQLNSGIRALLIDVHHWTTPPEVRAFLDSLPADQRAAVEPFTAGPQSARPGLWLCHNLCQLGGRELTGELARVRGWLAANPTAIVTFVVQDEVPAREVMDAFRQAGLERYLLTPPDSPSGSWPRLGDMVAQDRKLVVFAEQADIVGSWYRRLFRYASDTPYDVTTTDGFACEPNRGSTTAPMPLINHWVTVAAPSRYDATIVNRRASLEAHVRSREQARDRRPTFLAVNFSAIGDVVETVSRLNGGRR